MLALLNGVRKLFGSHANLHSVENWELVCLVGTKLSFFGRKYSFISNRIILCKNLSYSFIMGTRYKSFISNRIILCKNLSYSFIMGTRYKSCICIVGTLY